MFCCSIGLLSLFNSSRGKHSSDTWQFSPGTDKRHVEGHIGRFFFCCDFVDYVP